MGLIIPITDKYRIELDNYSWAVSLCKPRKDKSRKQWTQDTWHNTLLQAAENVRTRLICDNEPYGIDEVLQAMAQSTELLKAAIRDSGIPDSWLDAKNLLEE